MQGTNQLGTVASQWAHHRSRSCLEPALSSRSLAAARANHDELPRPRREGLNGLELEVVASLLTGANGLVLRGSLARRLNADQLGLAHGWQPDGLAERRTRETHEGRQVNGAPRPRGFE